MPQCQQHSAIQAQAGFLSLQGFAALALFTILAAALAQMFQMGMEELQKRALASQLQMVSEAAKTYASAEGLLETLSSDSAAVRVDVARLIEHDAMPKTSSDVLTNAFGQHYAVYFFLTERANTKRVGTVILTEGGEELGVAHAAAVTHCGSSGGIVENSNGKDVLRGVGGGFILPLNTAPLNIPSPGPGHIGYFAELDEAALLSNTLYRIPVPGRKELNQMHVDLDLRDHAINDVQSIRFNATSVQGIDMGQICGVSEEEKTLAEGKVFFFQGDTRESIGAGLYTCRKGTPFMLADQGNSPLLQKTFTVTPETSIQTPVCPEGQTPFISVAPAQIPDNLPHGATLRSYYTGDGSTNNPWVVHLDIDGVTETESGTLSVITSCSGGN